VQTKKVTSFPVVLFDRGYWSGLVDWLRGTLLDRGAIRAPDLDLFTVTDDVAEAVEVVKRGQSPVATAERPE
jgi:predicted Rossmann-fold nucleotide-binding protein